MPLDALRAVLVAVDHERRARFGHEAAEVAESRRGEREMLVAAVEDHDDGAPCGDFGGHGAHVGQGALRRRAGRRLFGDTELEFGKVQDGKGAPPGVDAQRRGGLV